MRRFCCGLLFLVGLIGTANAQNLPASAPEPAGYEVAGQDLRVAALNALRAGDLAAAAQIAAALLAEDPTDASGHFILAQVNLRLGDGEQALRAARQTWRHADSDTQRHEAARAAAAALSMMGRNLEAQLWLRRSLQGDLDPLLERRAGHELREARDRSRVHLQLNINVAPSNNVNDGASTPLSTVDGLPLTGILSPSAVALSGTKSDTSILLSYRLRRDETSETRLHANAGFHHVWLSTEARDKAPGVENDDFGSAAAELGLSHSLVFPQIDTRVSGAAFVGRSWSGGNYSLDYARISVSASRMIGRDTRLTLGFNIRDQWSDTEPANELLQRGWTLGIEQRIFGRDRLGLSFHHSLVTSPERQNRRTVKGLSIDYLAGRSLYGVRLGAGLSAFESDYPEYRVLLPVPGGRQDRRYRAYVDAELERYNIYGFAPTVTLSKERVESNVSRFETEEVSIGFGFRSLF